jgi:hypothetical protein
MTRTLILTAALTLGAAGPAAAQPVDSVGPYAPYTAVPITQQQPSGGSSGLENVLIGAGGVALVISGAAVATRRRRHTRLTVVAS